LAPGVNFKAVVTVRNTSGHQLQNLIVSEIFPSGWEILNTRFLPGGKDAEARAKVNSYYEDDEDEEDESYDSSEASSANRVNYQDIRDDRVYSYIDKLNEGSDVTVTINLTSAYSGKFYLPPVVCESMYDHQIQANSEGRQVVVE
jgi:uncharacterized protein YfaS (alpha-2-macroglobulin family)